MGAEKKANGTAADGEKAEKDADDKDAKEEEEDLGEPTDETVEAELEKDTKELAAELDKLLTEKSKGFPEVKLESAGGEEKDKDKEKDKEKEKAEREEKQREREKERERS